MPDILVPFSPDHLFYAVVAGSFGWGIITGAGLSWLLIRPRMWRAQGQALKERLGTAH